MKIKRKVIFLTYIPSPYRVDFFNELSKYCDLNVLYYYENMPNSPWKKTNQVHNYKYVFLLQQSRFKGLFVLLKLLYKNRNETIVVGGYSMLAEIFAIFFLKLLRVKFVLNSDGGFKTKGFVKTILKKQLIKSASYWLSSGINTSNTLVYYGAKPSNIFEYHFSSLFENEVLKKNIEGEELIKKRKRLNLKSNVTYVVFVGQLIHRKGLDILLEAVALMKNKKMEFLVIGAGDQMNSLKEYCDFNNIKERVHFIGKCPKPEVLEYLKVSDVFVFPSREDIWGLVLNEAVANGLPVISTKQVGSAYSLISDDENGYLINSDNVSDLVGTLDKLVFKNLNIMRLKSLEKAQKYTIENMVIDHMFLFNKLNLNE